MKVLGRILLAAVAYIVGVILTGIITTALRVPPMELPSGMTALGAVLGLMLATPLLTAAVLPLALGLRGAWINRCVVIGLFLFISIGVNTALEGAIFSTIMSGRGMFIAMQALLSCIFAAAVLTWDRHETLTEGSSPTFSGPGWAWRLGLGWLAFPVVYWLFGSMIAPFVMEYYRAGIGGLRIPPTQTILGMQFLRGALFLIASLPVALLWKQSRCKFIVSLGLAYAVAVGVFQLVQGTFLPVFLRVIHSAEIAADSLAYAAVIGLLFVPSVNAKVTERAKVAAV